MFFSGKRSTIAAYLLGMCLLFPSISQSQPRNNVLQIGPAVWHGIGLQVGFTRQRTIYSLESMLYANGRQRDRFSVQLSGGIGASVRPLGVLRAIGNADYGYDTDIGVRFGPSLSFTTSATRTDKNRQFHLFFDPFVRFSGRLVAGKILYAELGPLQPRVRLGILFDLTDQP